MQEIPLEQTSQSPDVPKIYEDTSFVTGESPVILDFNADVGKNARNGYIINDGEGNFTVSLSANGSTFGGEATVKKNEVINLANENVDTVRITCISDSSYRVSLI